ncbi:MAG: hypothetical protein AB7N80_02095 [Bdellovibrionales bacterium]
MQESGFPWDQWRSRLREAGLLLLRFARNPIEGMRNLPDWDWPFLLVCQAIAAAVCGVAAGITSHSILSVFTGLFFAPISNAIGTAVIAGFFYYTFGFVLHRPAVYQKIYTNLVFASLPAMLMWTVAPLLPPLSLLGLAASGFLLLVGFVDNLGQERRTMVRFLAGLYAVFVIFWITSAISHRRQVEVFRDKATPESLDILERELKDQ